MIELDSILVVLDPTVTEQPALERAILLAQRSGASLELFICDYDPHLSGERFFDAQSLEAARARLLDGHTTRLRELAKSVSERDVTVGFEAVWDRPLHEGIVRKALRTKPSLVVKDTHYHSAIRRSVFSNTDWQLIRDCPTPLLLVKPRALGKEVTILAAVDPLHERDKPALLDHRILDLGKSMSVVLGGSLKVLHAFDPAPAYAVSVDSMAFPISAPIKEMMQSLRQAHEAALDELVEGYALPKNAVHFLEGEVGEILVRLIEKLKADIVVMGAVSRSGLQRLVLGSTAERLLDRLPCDLLIVKPSTFATSVKAA